VNRRYKMLMINDDKRKLFKEAVKRLLAEREWTYRDAGEAAGLDSTTVWNMAQGKIPRPETLAKLIEALGADGLELARVANYPALIPTDPDTAADQLLDALDREELTYEPEWEGITAEAYLGAEEMSDNDRRRVQAAMRRVLEADKRRRERGKG